MSEITLTPEQEKAAHTIDRSVGIVANAGSGKTRVLVERVAHILASGETTLRQILVVTFTEKAAQELKNRLTDRLPDRRLELMTATITTFHGLAMRVLREHAPVLGISPEFRIASEGEAAALLHHAIEDSLLDALRHQDPHAVLLCQRFPFRTIIREMTPLLEDRWSFAQYLRGAPAASDVIAAIMSLFQKIDSRYKQLKRDDDILDFHDLEILTWQLFCDEPQILTDYQRQFKHLLIDEFQDTNPLQATIVRQLFTPPDNVLCIVGDPKQSIYRFRRADVGCFAQMLATIVDGGGETVVLPDNFRSSAGIVEFVNRICSEIPHYTPLVARRDVHSGQAVLSLPVPSHADNSAEERRSLEAEAVATSLRDLAGTCGGFGNIACLFQTRATLQLWADVFRKNNIPTHIYGSGGYWERPEIRALLFCLQVIVGLRLGQPDERHLLALLLSPLFAVSLDQVYRWMHLLPQTGHEDLPPLHRAVFTNAPIGAQLTEWQRDAITRTPYELMAKVMRDTDYCAQLNRTDPSGQASANAEAFLRRLHDMGRTVSRPLHLMLEQLLALRDRSERTPDTPATLVNDDAVQMMTIHAAKGNEFPVVVIPDLFRKPSTKTPQWLFEPELGFAVRYENDFDPKAADTAEWTVIRDHYLEDSLAERNRLLYVALTRAETQLIFPIHPDMKDSQKGRAIWHDLLRQ